jgi:hypothetical protein
MRTITIEWQRLVNNNGQTCDRCSCTGDATENAFGKLKRCLAEAGIKVVLEKHAIDQATFSENPLQSNQISIDGRTIEEWLGATTGQSLCCGPCGDSECRTLNVNGQTYEAIPETLILRAGLLAAAEKLRQ